jgi:hypothetical protein
MTLLDDAVSVTLLATAAFFVALSFGLLIRYREVSRRISASSDLGHDLWIALEQRMRKQDERILDMMGRLEVVQSRVMAAAAAPALPAVPPPPPPAPSTAPPEEVPGGVIGPSPVVQRLESHVESRESHESHAEPRVVELDETQLAAIRFLGESPRNTRQLTDALGKSREHTARLMKELFDLGFVSRNDATKPFVYQLTDSGRSFLTQN